MSSTTSRGNYYKKLTMELYQQMGFVVQLTEFNTARFIGPGKVIYVKKDVFGADGIAMNGKEIIFWNSKHDTVGRGETTVAREGKAEFDKFPFPPCVLRHIVYWVPRKKPIVIAL